MQMKTGQVFENIVLIRLAILQVLQFTCVANCVCSKLHVLQIANKSVANCVCCKLHVLQIGWVVNYTCCELHVLQIVCVANYACCKLHVLQIACVANWKCCKLQLLLRTAKKNKVTSKQTSRQTK